MGFSPPSFLHAPCSCGFSHFWNVPPCLPKFRPYLQVSTWPISSTNPRSTIPHFEPLFVLTWTQDSLFHQQTFLSIYYMPRMILDQNFSTTALLTFSVVWWLPLCVYLTGYKGTQIFGQILLWVFLWGCFGMRLMFKLVNFELSRLSFPILGKAYPTSWRFE